MTDPKAALQHLTEILTLENSALKRLDYAAAAALLPTKEAALAACSAPISPLSQALLQPLIDLATENQQLLERAIAVQTRIVGIVARATAGARKSTQLYGPNCRQSRGPVALAISERA
jgi:hypothetical protein